MRVTIITVCFNSQNTIEATLKSIASQTYTDIEYIVVDGASTDGTLQLLSKYKSNIHRLVSEPDNGLYDALNKGILLATGDIISILHSDDCFADDNVIEKIVKIFDKHPDKMIVLSELKVYRSKFETSHIRHISSQSFIPEQLKYGLMPPHTSTFIRKIIYETHGNFNTNYKIAADFDLFLRFFLMHQVSYMIAPFTTVKMMAGGLSNQGFRSYSLVSKELVTILKHQLSSKIRYVVWLRGFWKIGSYFSRRLK